jgi:hypothetical protein
MARHRIYPDRLQTASEAVYKYNKVNTINIPFRLNKKTDADVIARLNEMESKRGYLIDLVREDIEYERRQQNEGRTD